MILPRVAGSVVGPTRTRLVSGANLASEAGLRFEGHLHLVQQGGIAGGRPIAAPGADPAQIATQIVEAVVGFLAP